MSTPRIIARNIASNWIGFGVQVLVTFFLTPFVLHHLGDARYGAWVLLMSLTGYYGLLDLGFRSGVTQYITRYLAVGDYKKMNHSASSGFAAMAVCSSLISVATVVLMWSAPRVFRFAPGTESEVFWCILIVGGSTAVQFPLFPFSSVITATQRFDLDNMVGVTTRLLTASGTFLLLKLGYGLIGLSIVTAAGNLLDYLVRWRLAYRVLPELRVNLRLANWRSCRELLVFASWSSLIAASARIISASSAIIIGIFMPTAAIAWFALAVNLVSYFDRIFVPVGWVFFPVAAQLDARGDLDRLRRVYLTASRLMFLLAILAGTVSAFFAENFYRLWVGNAYVDSALYHPVPLLYQVLVVGSIITASQRIGYQVLFGRGQVRLLAQLFGCQAVVSLLLTVLLIHPFGLLGVTLGNVLPVLIFQGIVQPFFVCRGLRISLSDYAQEVLWRPTAFAAILLPLGLASRALVRVPSTWPGLLLAGTIAAVLCVLLGIPLVLTRNERVLAWKKVGRLIYNFAD